MKFGFRIQIVYRGILDSLRWIPDSKGKAKKKKTPDSTSKYIYRILESELPDMGVNFVNEEVLNVTRLQP